MRKISKTLKFLKLFDYWCIRLFKRTYPSRNDSRYGCCVCIEGEKKNFILVYNAKKMKQLDEKYIVLGVFHEIGHTVYDSPYETIKQQEEAEYEAEKYALRMVKKHYPKIYNAVIKRGKEILQTKSFQREAPMYFRAYNRIKEYQ